MAERLMNKHSGITTRNIGSGEVRRLIMNDEKLLSRERGRLCEAVERNILCGLVATKHKDELIAQYTQKGVTAPVWLQNPVMGFQVNVPLLQHKAGILGGSYNQVDTVDGLLLGNAVGMHHNAPGVVLTGKYAGMIIDHTGDYPDWSQGAVINRLWHSTDFSHFPYEPYFQVPQQDLLHATEEVLFSMIGGGHQKKMTKLLWARYQEELQAIQSTMSTPITTGDAVISLAQSVGFPVSAEEFSMSEPRS